MESHFYKLVKQSNIYRIVKTQTKLTGNSFQLHTWQPRVHKSHHDSSAWTSGPHSINHLHKKKVIYREGPLRVNHFRTEDARVSSTFRETPSRRWLISRKHGATDSGSSESPSFRAFSIRRRAPAFVVKALTRLVWHLCTRTRCYDPFDCRLFFIELALSAVVLFSCSNSETHEPIFAVALNVEARNIRALCPMQHEWCTYQHE